jgi:hypothetical protein
MGQPLGSDQDVWANAWSEFVQFLDSARDPPADALDKFHRILERPVPASELGPRPLPQRAGRAQMHLPRRPITRPKATGQERWMTRSKPAFNVFAITFEGCLL